MNTGSIVNTPPLLRVPQSRGGSLVEAVVNVVFGFLLAFVMQGLIYPFLGIVTTAQTNLLIAAIFTLLSVVRSYLVRRAFETYGRK
jgi:uncharacterized protein (DUF697 family)